MLPINHHVILQARTRLAETESGGVQGPSELCRGVHKKRTSQKLARVRR